MRGLIGDIVVMSSRQQSSDSLQAAAPVPSHSRSPSGSVSGVREDGAAGSPPAASSAETKVRKVSLQYAQLPFIRDSVDLTLVCPKIFPKI